MLDTELKFSYKDVSIVPAAVSPIDSRKDCNPYVEEGTNKLPLFTAPMDSVIGINNMDLWVAQGITPIIPRTESLTDRLQLLSLGYWVAMSLGEFEEYFVKSIWDGWDGKGSLELPVYDDLFFGKDHEYLANRAEDVRFVVRINATDQQLNGYWVDSQGNHLSNSYITNHAYELYDLVTGERVFFEDGSTAREEIKKYIDDMKL